MLKQLWIGIIAILVLAGCNDNANGYRCLLPAGTELKEGDVVYRRGGGLVSHVVVAADRGGNYSHIGIVVDSAGKKMIVHAVPGEPDFEGDEDRVKMDTPERFFSSEHTSVGEICRMKDSTAAKKAARAAIEAYNRHTLFDHEYNDNDTVKMYCTELVVWSYKKAGINIVGNERHHVSIPFLETYCIFPSDVYKSEYFKSIIIF
jgi:hypothetical protein